MSPKHDPYLGLSRHAGTWFVFLDELAAASRYDAPSTAVFDSIAKHTSGAARTAATNYRNSLPDDATWPDVWAVPHESMPEQLREVLLRASNAGVLCPTSSFVSGWFRQKADWDAAMAKKLTYSCVILSLAWIVTCILVWRNVEAIRVMADLMHEQPVAWLEPLLFLRRTLPIWSWALPLAIIVVAISRKISATSRQTETTLEHIVVALAEALRIHTPAATSPLKLSSDILQFGTGPLPYASSSIPQLRACLVADSFADRERLEAKRRWDGRKTYWIGAGGGAALLLFAYIGLNLLPILWLITTGIDASY